MEDRILTVFTEDRCGDEVLEDAAVSVKRTNHLTPNQELAHLLCKLPQFLLRHSNNRLYDISLTKCVWLSGGLHAVMLLSATRRSNYITRGSLDHQCVVLHNLTGNDQFLQCSNEFITQLLVFKTTIQSKAKTPV